jgi:hypothetical protein
MRRTMHAIGLFLALSSTVLAQETKQKLVHNQQVPAMHAVPNASLMVPNTGDCQNCYSGSMGNEQQYSQLAARMSCNDCCSDFWAGYASERSALAARLCQSGGCGSSLYATPCTVGCGTGCGSGCSSGCGGCGANPGVKPLDLGCLNRYKQPWSSLYGVPAPGMGCGPCQKGHGLGHRKGNSCDPSPVGVLAPCGEGCSTGGCTTGGCTTGQCSTGACATYPVPQTQPRPAGMTPLIQGIPSKVAHRGTLPPTSGSWAR